MATNKKIGLALGSGSFRGFAHIGVLKSLLKNNIKIDYISGSSIGAWVAAYFALFGEIDQLRIDITENPKDNLFMLLDPTNSGGLISGAKFYNFLKKNLQNKNFSDTKIPLRILAADAFSGRSHIFNKGELALAVRASTSVPIVFKPVSFEGKLLVDGGLSNPIPGKMLKDQGADIVIGVNLYHHNEFIKEKFSMRKIAMRSTRIALYNLAQVDLNFCDIKIEPDISLFSKKIGFSQFFTKEIAEEIVKIGEETMDKNISKIKTLLKK